MRNQVALPALLMLAVVAVVLSALALNHNRGLAVDASTYTYERDAKPSQPSVSEDHGSDDGAESTANDSLNSEGKEPEDHKADVPKRFLSLGADGHIFRGEVGSCTSAPAWSEVSFDDGATWQSTNADMHGSVQILAVRIASSDIQELVTLNSECEPVVLRSYIGGISWTELSGASDERWYVEPAHAELVNTPAGEFDASCELAQVSSSPSLDIGAALCQDAQLVVSNDRGATWSESQKVEGAVNVAVTNENVVLAISDMNGCQGIQVSMLDEDLLGSAGECLVTSAPRDEIAIAAFDEMIIVWEEDQFHRSPDGGRTWR